MILDTKQGAVAAVARPANPYGAFSALATDTYTGKNVTPEQALALASVYGCVSLISNACGSMPLEVIDTRNEARPVVDRWQGAIMLRHAPNPDTSGVAFWTLVFSHLLLRGNAYLLKEKQNGNVVALWPIRPDRVSVYRDEAGAKTFRVRVYESAEWVEIDFTSDDVIHVMGPSFDDGLMGASPIALMRNRLGVQLSQSEFQARFYQRGMSIQAAVQTPERLNEEAVQRVKRAWRAEYGGVGNSYGVAVMHSGSTVVPLSITPKDAEFIASMRMGANEIATAYNVPASRLNAEGASLTYANQGQDDLFLYKQAFAPRLAMVESALNLDTDLFGSSSSWVPRFNADSQLRADVETRYRVYAQGRSMGVLSVNDVRRIENMPPVSGGDEYQTQSQVAAAVPAEKKSLSGGAMPAHIVVPPSNVTINQPEQRFDIHVPEQRELPAPVVNVDVAAAVPEIRVDQSPPVVHVNVPEQPAPVVNVDVAAPDVRVDVAAPNVQVDPVIEVEVPSSSKTVEFKRDGRGLIVGAKMGDE